MIELMHFEGKTKEEAIEKLEKETGLLLKDFYIKESESEAKLFKGKKIILEVTKKQDVIKEIKDFIRTFAYLMNLEINSEVNEKEDVINVLLVSNNNPVLIGKDGRTLNSVQMLLRQAMGAKLGFNVKINVDASNYKAKKMNNLEYNIRKIIKEVLDTHQEVVLDPMNSYERRYVHSLVSEHAELTSLSSGEGAERKITIGYKESE